MDSIDKYSPVILGHINYHEQAAAFAACGYAQVTHKPGVAYATSGPGATNLVTGISNAYFDSIPAIFITGQVDTYAARGDYRIRQRGFQETDIVNIVKSITKYCAYIDSADKVQSCLEEAYFQAVSGRPGPVLIDIPADIQRADISPRQTNIPQMVEKKRDSLLANSAEMILELIKQAERPCLILGSGIKQCGLVDDVRRLLNILRIPVVTSMVAFDILPASHPMNFGFIGSNGHRYSNFIVAKSDLVVTLGTRLDLKQVGNKREQFAPKAKIIRVDIDEGELGYRVRSDEIHIVADLRELVPTLIDRSQFEKTCFLGWLAVCDELKLKLEGFDRRIYHQMIAALSDRIPDDIIITVDVGQHQPWVAQSYKVKERQKICFSGGLGSMGYSLPAAIGAYYASRKPVVSINGDGGIQMNIQELQFLAREQLPILIVVINNYALGMIRYFQEMNFASKYVSTTRSSGYSPPDFGKIAHAYGLDYFKAKNPAEVITFGEWAWKKPTLIEIELDMETYLEPKFASNRPTQDQEPFIDRSLYDHLMTLCV
jgi:acetolactate synthase I/II/III large subunit